ncbi:MAG: pyridoxal phosphate-dependent aminotransferase, partial [Melioribacteraceae bacterium]|nr:pyridoxal phosphate-dependent aminotransferase [Melioribacteraceae bacterium]
GVDVINLSLGEPDFDTPGHIKSAAVQALTAGQTKYTPVPGRVDFREAIKTKFKRDNNLDYELDQIVVSNGAKQCIANVCLAMIDPGDEVIIFTPYWVSYRDIVQFSGGVPIELAAGIEQDFKVTAQQLENAISDKTKLIIFSSPCNPTGSVYLNEELESLAAVIQQKPGIYVVSDEIYEFINFSGSHASIGALPGMYERTITVNGMSKGFAMTGWRIGYMAGPKWLAKACAKIQGQFTSGASSFGQKASAHALLNDMGPTHGMCIAFEKRKKLIISLLNKIEGIVTNDPQGAFYIFPDVSYFFGKSNDKCTIRNSDDFAEAVLTQAHVALVSGSAFGDHNCIRISYAASEEEIREAISRLHTFLSSLQ